MSYILDALRRADAERRRGSTPALQQVAQAGDWPARAAVGGPRRWLSPAVVAIALLACGLVIWWQSRPSATPTPAAAPTVATAPASPAVGVPPPPAAVPITAPAPAPVAITAPAPVPVTPLAPVPVPAPAAAVAPTPARPAAPAPSPARAPALARAPVAAPAPAPAPAPPPSSAAAVAAPAAPAAAPRPIPVSALPEPQRSQLAGLAFGGAVHSQDRTQSFVLQGGQLVREGQKVAPGVVLERIEPRALVLRVGEQRVLLPL